VPPAKLDGQAPPAAPKPHYYPERAVTLLAPFARGSLEDRAARALAASAEKGMGFPLVVVNREGDPGSAWAELKRARPDGYTLGILTTPEFPVFLLEQRESPPMRLSDLSIIGGHLQGQRAILVRASSPYRTIGELIAAAAAQPESISLGFGPASLSHRLAAAGFQHGSKARLRLTPFSDGSGVLMWTVNGDVEAALGRLKELGPAVRSGQGRLLAILDEARSPDYPTVPTLREAGMELVSYSGLAYAAPAGTAREIVDYLSWAFYGGATDPNFRREMAEVGPSFRYLDSRALSQYLVSESERVKPLLPLK